MRAALPHNAWLRDALTGAEVSAATDLPLRWVTS